MLEIGWHPREKEGKKERRKKKDGKKVFSFFPRSLVSIVPIMVFSGAARKKEKGKLYCRA